MRLSNWKTRAGVILLSASCLALASDNPLSQRVASGIRALRHGGTQDAARLFVFVGQKIEVRRIEHEPCAGCVMLDGRYLARYRVVTPLYGAFDESDITFEAYDHYGEPAFSRHRHALLFVSRTFDGTYLHHKYVYYPVFRTRDGNWAGCGRPSRLRGKDTAAPASRVLDYEPAAWLSTAGLGPDEIAEAFPAPYFRIEGERAHCVMGNTAEELLEVARRGVLAARGMTNWK